MCSTGQRLNREISTPNPDGYATEAVFRPSSHDRWMRVIGLLLLGVAIPRFALLFDKLTWGDANYWLGSTWFMLVAVAIWESNRLLALQLRTHLDWLVQPFWKLAIFTAATIGCTLPLTIGGVWLWLQFIRSPYPILDWLATIRTIATNNIVTVLFLLHAYETLFLIRERRGDRRRMENLERARLQAELDGMKSQLAPHFLFNCLNTLTALIERDPPAAAEFNTHLADVTRYLLAHKDHDLVPLADEITFLRSYVRLMELRYPHSLQIALPEVDDSDPRRIPPASLQLLIENAIKHNRLSADEPLAIDVALESDAIRIANPIRRKNMLAPGTGTGLANLRERVALLTPGSLDVRSDDSQFEVRLPLAHA
jgi:hypothetical protein